MASFLYFCGCRLKPVLTFVFFITYFMYCACSRASIENVDSRRLSLQMFSTANCGWLQGTGSITVRICFPLKWRKKSLLWSLWTVQDTGKYIANSGYQRLCWLKKIPNEIHSASFACVIINMDTFSYSFCQEWCNYMSCCLHASSLETLEKCHFTIIRVTPSSLGCCQFCGSSGIQLLLLSFRSCFISSLWGGKGLPTVKGDCFPDRSR